MSLNEADFSQYLEENSPIPPDVVFLVQVKFRVNNFRLNKPKNVSDSLIVLKCYSDNQKSLESRLLNSSYDFR